MYKIVYLMYWCNCPFVSCSNYFLSNILDYIELAIQFGFATLFSSAFPLAPLCAFLNNLFEIRLDAQKYTKYKMRTVPIRKRYELLHRIFTQKTTKLYFDVFFDIFEKELRILEFGRRFSDLFQFWQSLLT